MSISGKARRAMATGQPSQTISESSTLVRVNPVVRRLRAVVTELGDFVMSNGDARQMRMQRILNIVIDEAMEELSSVPDDSLTIWMSNMARITQWAATGDMSILPEDLVPFACKVEGINYAEYVARMAERQAENAEEDIAEAELLPIES